jgi:hypothetical protein
MKFFVLYRTARWPLELSTRIEKQAFDKSNGIKVNKNTIDL